LAELECMMNNKVPPYSERTVTLTVEGRLILAMEALAAAQKACQQKRQARLCEKAIMYLRPVVLE
jgi:hypothetical protein